MDVVDWLLDSDPAIRWQVMRDIVSAPAEEVAAERARVATEGWGAELLSRQTPDGQWGGDPSIQRWESSHEWACMMSLGWLHDMGLDPASGEASHAVGLSRDNVKWLWWGNNPFFVGEVEPCINGRVAAIGAYFGEDVQALIDRLVGEQMEDGGWNCEQENGSKRGSFGTTINVLEGLLEHEQATGGSDRSKAARLRGQEYLLSRRLMRRLSSGELVDAAFTQLSFPTSYRYDVLRGLDYLRAAGALGDERVAEAIEVVKRKRDDGRWRLDVVHPQLLDLDIGEREGHASRWLTLRSLRVLKAAER